MKKTIKKIAKIALIVIICVSFGLNIYYFGWKRLERKIYQRGIAQCVNTILTSVRQRGEVRINNLILVPKRLEE